MRTSQYLLSTLKETPADAEVISHQLMLRAGMIRKLASGLYTWLPTGVRVLKKVENIVREEMNNAGAIEVSMPVVQPADLWQESGRWEQYGPELLRFVDRGERPFVLGPTHEEVITDLIRNELSSYKQLPLNFYQIQTKFRDEVRPRFGVMRSREFLMKDAYSFHTSQESLQETYDAMYAAYSKIFSRMGLDFRAVQADTGSIGGSASHEFQVLAQSGEDDVVFSDTSDYAANIELAEAIAPKEPRAAATQEMTLVDTPNAKTIAELVEQFNLPIKKTVKTLLVKAVEGSSFPLVALLVRGDHELNEVKAEKLPQVASPLTFATEEEIRAVVKAGPGSLGPVNMPIPVVIDRTVAAMSDFTAGANIDGKHYFGINWDRDVATPEVADIRNVVAGDPSPDGQGTLLIKRGIEVGHIFQLGTKYSEALKASVQGEDGRNQILTMGCYGIGVTRVVAAAIEQNYDERGIVWPDAIAPFQVAILPMNMHKSFRVQELAEKLYSELRAQGIEVLLDDRKERPGVMFADMELIGIPHTIVLGDRNLDNDDIEYKYRRNGEKQLIKTGDIVEYLVKQIKADARKGPEFQGPFLHGLYKMDKPKAYCRLLLPCFLLLSACTVDISQPDSSATAVDAEAKTWAVKFQHQSSFTEQSIKEITVPDLKPGDLLFSSSLEVTSFGIRVFSTSSVSHVAIYLGENNVAEATGAGVQIVSLKKAMKHSDKLFVLRVPDLTPQQATEITAFANKIKDSGYNYRGIVEFIPFMVTRQMCSLNPFSEDFRQQCVSGLAKAQLSSVVEGDKKSWFCSEFVTDAFAKAGHPLTLAQSGWISLPI